MLNLLKSSPNRKGVIILRMDEVPLLEWLTKSSYASLKENNFIGVHFGWYAPKQVIFPIADFYLAHNGVTFVEKPTDPVYRLSSRNFIPAYFRCDTPYFKRAIDVLYISNALRIKHTHDFFKSLVNAVRLNPKLHFKVVLIACDAMGSLDLIDNIDSDLALLNKYTQNSSSEVLILKRSSFSALYPLSENTILSLLHNTKIFAHFGEEEGDSRAIPEAIQAGCHVVAYSGLRGSGLDPLNNKNATLFNSYDASHLAIEEALTTLATQSISSYDYDYDQDQSTTKLLDILNRDFFASNTLELSDLNPLPLRFGLPGHYSYSSDRNFYPAMSLKSPQQVVDVLNHFNCTPAPLSLVSKSKYLMRKIITKLK